MPVNQQEIGVLLLAWIHQINNGGCACAPVLSYVWFFATPWAIARQAPLSMGFLRQEYRSGLPFPPPGVFLTRDWTCVFFISCIDRWILYYCATWDAPALIIMSSQADKSSISLNSWEKFWTLPYCRGPWLCQYPESVVPPGNYVSIDFLATEC